jgi:hypothetical protein
MLALRKRQLSRVSLPMKKDATLDPADIRLFMPDANLASNVVEQH